MLLSVSKWIEKERPYFEYGEDYEDMMKDRLLEPDDEEATELGEVPQDKSKGFYRAWLLQKPLLDELYFRTKGVKMELLMVYIGVIRHDVQYRIREHF